MSHPLKARRQVALGALTLTLLAVTGCGQTASTEQRAATTPTTSAASWLTSPTGGGELAAAVRAYWHAYLTVTAGSLGEPATTAIVDRVAAGSAARALVDVASNDAIAGVTVRGELVSHPRVLDQTPTSARITDCVDDRTGAHRADGSRLDTDDPKAHQVAFTLTRSSGQWRVTDIQVLETSCAAS